MRSLFVATAVFTTVSCSSGEANIDPLSEFALDGKSICGQSVGRYIQIEFTNVDAGIGSIDSFRINEEGLLSHATWQLNGSDVVSASSTELGTDAFLNIENALTGLTLSFPPDDGTLRQPGGFTFRAASVSTDSIEYQSGSLGGDALLPIIDGWRADSTLSSVSGDFFWTLPLADSVGTASIDVEDLGCEHPVSMALADGLVSDTVLLPASEELTSYLNGVSGGSVFNASTPVGTMFIGVVPQQ